MQWPIFRASSDVPQASPGQQRPLRIGSLGRLHPVKGYDVLIDALSLLPRTIARPDVVVAGEGAERAALEARAEAADVAIDFAGYAEDPGKFLAGLDFYVQPSRSEGLCVAAHEAMQAGLPVIASAVGQLPYSITQERAGATVPPDDPQALADALARLLVNPEQLSAMGAIARGDVLARFGAERFRTAGLAILERMRGF
jgi:glycosyltransferase involved in cell wall biosynthesis